jgi:hypothetical protein
MGGSRKNSPMAASFDEWKKCFLREADEDGRAVRALNRVAGSEAEIFVVLELLFHHVNGNYGFGAGPGDWEAFRNELNGVRKRALNFASEMQRLRHLRIFSLPFEMPAFLAREGRAFPWRQTIEWPAEAFWGSAAEELTRLADYIKHVITQGDKTWDFRDFGNLNLILLSIYLKRITGEWQDEAIAALLRISFKAAGKHWKSEKNPAAAIREIRLRFRTADPRFKWLLGAVNQTARGRLVFWKRKLERKRKNLSPLPAFMKRYRDHASMQRDLDRSFKRRHRFDDLSTAVMNFVGLMEIGDTKDFNGSLLDYLNLCNVLQLKDWDSMRLGNSST